MNDNKYMFEAKRMDNGEMVTGLYTKAWEEGLDGQDAIEVFNGAETSIHNVDPSTIKPLFTTDKRDLWLFENAERKTFIDCTAEEKEIITQAKGRDDWSATRYVISVSEWEKSPSGDLHINYIYRVKTPSYSLFDAMTDARNSTEEAVVFEGEDMVILARDVKEIINKLAKANGLVGNDE